MVAMAAHDITVDLPPGWDGEGEVEWLAGEAAMLGIRSDLVPRRARLVVDGAVYFLEWTPGEPELLFMLEGLAVRPEAMRAALAQGHATATDLADYLVKKSGTKILDIGSGAGKFCLIGAIHTKGNFTGVEQRENLVAHSNKIASRYEIDNVTKFLFIDTYLSLTDIKPSFVCNFRLTF